MNGKIMADEVERFSFSIDEIENEKIFNLFE
jgi:hypothetical protein